MKKQIKIIRKNGGTKEMEVNYLETSNKFLTVGNLDVSTPHVIIIRHEGLNTQLECSGTYHAKLIYLGEDGSIAGASFISPSNQGTFGIVTQAKYIFFVPALFKIDVNSIQSIQIIP